MDRYYYINVIFITNELGPQINMEAVVINKCHELKHCPILAVRSAILNEKLSQFNESIKDMGNYAMQMSCCQEIDFSEYQGAIKSGLAIVTIKPVEKG